jgi:hypothetical protein
LSGCGRGNATRMLRDQALATAADRLDTFVRTTGRRNGKPARPAAGGPSPWLVLGAAFAAGVLAAKILDWRGHAHPRW